MVLQGLSIRTIWNVLVPFLAVVSLLSVRKLTLHLENAINANLRLFTGPQSAAQPLAAGPRNLLEAAAEHVTQQRQPDEAALPTLEPTRTSAQSENTTCALEALQNNPQMIQLHQLAQQNHHLLQPCLQQLAKSDPNLLAGLTRCAGVGGADDQTQYVQVGQEECDAIKRLVGTGFERQLVLQAYFACDKNAKMAANYSIEHDFDDLEDAAERETRKPRAAIKITPSKEEGKLSDPVLYCDMKVLNESYDVDLLANSITPPERMKKSTRTRSSIKNPKKEAQSIRRARALSFLPYFGKPPERYSEDRKQRRDDPSVG
ncbi:hypothetical protein MJO29_016567 [Puccinia striiformis f. sp. tritici]|nr:hypothetical protein MJO29_016567 [Puccinia striiformis f. sp. tritici]